MMFTRAFPFCRRRQPLSSIRYRSLWSLLIGLAFGAVASHGLATAQFVNISVEQGLSQGTVQTIAQDHLGFLWFGTDEGLNRYDGYSFLTYKHDVHDPQSLPDSIVSAVFEDSRHRMWVGTEHGLCTFDPATGTFSSIKAIADRVVRIVESSDGTIWVAAIGGGLFLLKPNATAFVSFQPVANDPRSLASFQVSAVLEDSPGKMWVGTLNNGLEYFSSNGAYGEFTHHPHDPADPDSLAHNEIWGLAKDKSGRIWVAMYGGGLDRLDPNTGKFRHYRHSANDPASLPTDLITTVFVDRSGEVWAGSDGAGLLKYDAKVDRFLAFAHKTGDSASLRNNVVRTIFQDRQGQIWVGTFLAGVSQLKPAHPEFAYYNHDDANPDSVSDPAVGAFVEDSHGQIWLGTEGGWLNRFDRNSHTFTHVKFPTATGLSAAILALVYDHQGRLWLGTYRGGLARYDPETNNFTTYRHNPDDPRTLRDDEVWSIAVAPDGALWLATNAGVDRFDPESGVVTEHLATEKFGFSLSSSRVVRFDPQGNLWIGSFDGLTLRPAQGGAMVRYQHREGDPRSLSNDSVAVLHFDQHGQLWVGTLGGGVNAFDAATGTFRSFADFPSNVVDAIEEDDRGRLWISTDHGLSRLSPDSGAVENFDLTNGLQSLHFHLGAGLRTRDNRLLFGSNDGWYDLNPDSIHPSDDTPPVVLTGLRIFNVPARALSSLPHLPEYTLRPGDKIVSVEFAALDYTFPRRNQYAYQLSGLSDRWVKLGEKREITFTNLAPATYTLRVKATNSDGMWREGSSLTLQVNVLPPLWATWWFRGGAALIAAAVLWGGHRLRVRWLTQKLLERRRTEAALRASEQRFSRAFHVSPVPMCIVRLIDRTFVDVNDAFAKLVGYAHTELVGHAVGDFPFVTEADAARLGEAVRQPLGAGELVFRVRRKNGDIRTVLASVATTELAGQACALGVANDITERERAEKGRRESEDRYRRFFDDGLAGAFICAPDGRLLAVNPAFAHLFGFSSAEHANGQNLFALWPDRVSTDGLLARLKREHKLKSVEYEMRRLDGKTIHVIATVIGAFAENGELIEINGYVIDTTERKKLEEQLLQSQKMEAVGQLAGGVAHDFNNLLTGIIGYTDLLLMEGRLDSESCGSLQEIRGAASRAAALTRQLLAFSRRQLLQPRVIDLNALVSDMENMLRRLIGEDIDLLIALSPDLGRVRADRSQIEQVIMNLVVNARDAMPRGGRLTIDTTNVSIDAAYAAEHVGVEVGSYVRLAVSDTGCGMDAETQARVFEPFFTTKAVGKGTGLGLSTVYGIIKQSNGHIALYSEPDSGSTFKIYLPRVDALHSTEETVNRSRTQPGGNETVLLVEDNEVVRKATARILRHNGYDVLEAGEATGALAIFERETRPIQLLLTDVIMPGMNGRELAEELTRRAPHLRVLYMSGYTDDAISRHGGLSADMVFLEKPFGPDALVAKIQEALRGAPRTS